MSDTSEQLIRLAVARTYISQPQADLLQEELFMFPGGNVLVIMMKRGMITPEQAKALEDELAGAAEKVNNDDLDLEFNASSSRPAFTLPPAPPKPAAPMASRLSEAISVASQAANLGRPGQPPHQPAPLNSPVARKPLFEPAPDEPASDIRPDPLMLRYLSAGRERDCSDLHITIGKPPYFRQHGSIFFMDEPAITPAVAQQLCMSVLTKAQQNELKTKQQVDFSFGYKGVGRYRANVYKQRLGFEGAFRFIPTEVPTLESLKLPKVLEKLTTYPQGLNLVTGPGGSGKTSTVAAMLEYVNLHRKEHIITVEDPVEYILKPQNCQITQREVGSHTDSFASALRTALRQDPDVIMIGELRDLETTSISITAAETGHLVFGTLHTSSAIRTVARILDVYPPNQRSQICLMVAESLRGIMSQMLIPRKQGKGRVCAMEVLLVTTGVSQVIKEGKTHQLVSHMQSGRRLGMISMDDALMELLQSGAISGKEAYANAENKNMFEMARNQA